jgi:hypothetical protein
MNTFWFRGATDVTVQEFGEMVVTLEDDFTVTLDEDFDVELEPDEVC